MPLPPDAIWKARPEQGFRIHRLASDGPLVVFDQLGYGDDTHTLGRTIYLADLSDSSVRAIATGDDGMAAQDPDISGKTVVWVEWRYPASSSDAIGPVDWRVMSLDLSTSVRRQLAAGTNHLLRGGAASPPKVHIDGTTVAIGLEDATGARPDGWKIRLIDLATLKTVREVATARWLYQFDVWDGAVAFTDGAVDPAQGFSYDTTVWLDVGGSTTMVAKDGFEIAFADQRLAWVADPGSSQSGNGLAEHPSVWESPLSHVAPMQISAPAGDQVKGSQWVAGGGDELTWSDNVDTGVNGESGSRLVLWTERSGTVSVDSTDAILQGVGSGWLTWYDDTDPDAPFFGGIDLTSAGLP